MIEKTTLEFLKKLKKNNDREWFEKNKNLYIASKENIEAEVELILNGVRGFDKRIEADLTAKKCLFRIFRDVRFSKNKAPYKTNMGASINPGGRMAVAPGYYVHIEPSGSFLAGGMYMPPAPELAKVRQEIDYNLDEFKKIISDKNFKKYFGALSQENVLVTAPKGYAKDHPAIEILKLKSFIVVHDLTDEEVMKKDFAKKAAAVFQAMHPLALFLQRAID